MLTFNHKENEKLFANVNKNLSDFEHDHLHHLLLNKSQNDLKSMFGDVRVSLNKLLFFVKTYY